MATYESKDSKGKEYGSQGVVEFLTEAASKMMQLNEMTKRVKDEVNAYRKFVNTEGIRDRNIEEHLKNKINKLTKIYGTIQRKTYQDREKLESEAKELLKKGYVERVKGEYVPQITELEEWENQLNDRISQLQKLRKQLEELEK